VASGHAITFPYANNANSVWECECGAKGQGREAASEHQLDRLEASLPDKQAKVHSTTMASDGSWFCDCSARGLGYATARFHELNAHAEPALDKYDALRAVLLRALEQAEHGKGKERHASEGEAFHEQQIVKFGEWLGSCHFQVGQACKKAIESTRLPRDRAVAELLGAMVYLAAAVLVVENA
jgi:hypothetical protein